MDLLKCCCNVNDHFVIACHIKKEKKQEIVMIIHIAHITLHPGKTLWMLQNGILRKLLKTFPILPYMMCQLLDIIQS